MEFKTYDIAKKWLSDFFQKYSHLQTYVPPNKPRTNRIPRAQRICRFCDKRTPDVKFNSDPHIISTLLISNFGVSDYECDQCNNKFAKYESHLADHLGLERTIVSVGNNNRVPTFKTVGETLIAKIDKERSEKGITIHDPNKRHIEIDTTTGVNTIRYKKHPYIPINAYKALVKIALTALDEMYISYYPILLRFLNTEENDPYFLQFAKVQLYTTNHRVAESMCFYFKKKDKNKPIPTHIFSLYFENSIYQFFLPGHIDDLWFYHGKELTTIYPPPFIPDEISPADTYSSKNLDFSSTHLVKDEEGKIIFRVNPDTYKSGGMIDPKTNEIYDFDPKKIVKIHFFRTESTHEE